MKLNLEKKELETLEALFEQNARNIEVSQLVNQYLIQGFDCIDEEDMSLIKNSEGFLEKEAFETLFYSYLNVAEEDPEIETMKKLNHFGEFDLLNPKEFTLNPFYQNIKVKEVKKGNLHLFYNQFAPYEGFAYEETKNNPNQNYAESTPLGYFKTKVPYLALAENDVVWMSITPHEINTMKNCIQKATGNVMTFGLGLGYYAYMVSIKEEVKTVTVIEKDSKVIELFKQHILPLFPHPEKIIILQGDAFSCMNKAVNFDTLFIDIYHTAEDALPLYLKFKRRESKLHFPYEIDYWIETSILALLRRYVLVLLQENLEGYEESDYLNDTNEEERILKALFFALKNYHATSLVDIHTLLSDDGLKKLAASVNY